MSVRDRDLLQKVGLSAAKVGELLGVSRQAISKGVAAERDYFDPTDLEHLTEAVGRRFPDKKPALQRAIGDMFETLAERFAAGGESRAVETALAQAERVWLVLPRFPTSSREQAAAYDSVFRTINERKPPDDLSDSGDQLEVVCYTDAAAAEVEHRFHDDWFEQRQVIVFECEVVIDMSPMIVVDPHKDDANICFQLVMRGFEPVAPGEAVQLVRRFGALVTAKMREAAPQLDGRPPDARRTPVSRLSALGTHKL